MMQFTDLLLHPERFFAASGAGEPNLRVPALIALCGAVVSGILGYLMSEIYAEMFSAAAGAGIGAFLGIIAGISAFLGFLVIWWLVFAGVFFVISIPMKGKGPFTRTLANVGYGLVPTVIGSVLTLVLSFLYLPRVHVILPRNLQDPAALTQAMTGIMQDPVMREFTMVSSLISILFLIWSANIWIFGIRQARELTTRNAVITVILPVAVYIAYMIYTLIAGVPGVSGGM
ncbi:MAG: YIP1 family protein [Methanolinea sp.]|nr:YIP1 family protein [Methanolinea sp.]